VQGLTVGDFRFKCDVTLNPGPYRVDHDFPGDPTAAEGVRVCAYVHAMLTGVLSKGDTDRMLKGQPQDRLACVRRGCRRRQQDGSDRHGELGWSRRRRGQVRIRQLFERTVPQRHARTDCKRRRSGACVCFVWMGWCVTVCIVCAVVRYIHDLSGTLVAAGLGGWRHGNSGTLVRVCVVMFLLMCVCARVCCRSHSTLVAM
jgi:hypothetical protein